MTQFVVWSIHPSLISPHSFSRHRLTVTPFPQATMTSFLVYPPPLRVSMSSFLVCIPHPLPIPSHTDEMILRQAPNSHYSRATASTPLWPVWFPSQFDSNFTYDVVKSRSDALPISSPPLMLSSILLQSLFISLTIIISLP